MLSDWQVEQFDKFLDVERGLQDFHDYQWEGLEFIWERPFSALFIDTGLGKTAIILALLHFLLEWGMLEKVLIVGPMRVIMQTWPTELRLWRHSAYFNFSIIRHEEFEDEIQAASDVAARNAAAQGMPGHEVQRARQQAKTAAKERIRIRQANSAATLHFINREALPWLVKLFGKKWPYRILILDESSGYKDHTTQGFKSLQKILPFVERMHELTATPAAEGYMGLFAQIFLLDRGERFGRFITHYRENYFKYDRYDRRYTLMPGSEDKIIGKISDICLVMKAEDCLPDLEQPLIVPKRIKLLPHELRQYRAFKREFILDLPDGTEVEAETAAALAGKLLQLASGAVYDAAGKTHVLHDHKIEALREVCAEAESPVLVAYWYKSSRARLQKAFPDMRFMGREGLEVEPWNQGVIPLLGVHPRSVGHGLNMQLGPGHTVAFFDMPWSYELWYQLIRRIARQGQRFKARVVAMLSMGTDDETVFARLFEKRDAQDVLFRKLREYRRKLLLDAKRKAEASNGSEFD